MNASPMSHSAKVRLFDRWAPAYDWLFPSVIYQAIHQRLLEFVELPEAANVLDLGCGTGKLLKRLAAQFPELRGSGLDFSAEMIHQAQHKNVDPARLTFVQGSTDALPFAASQFDAVFSTVSFIHYPDPKAVFAEIYRVLKPGGCFYWADPAPGKGHAGVLTVPITPNGFRLYSLETRQQLGQTVGFQLVRHEYLLGLVVLSQFVKAATENEFRPVNEQDR